MNSHVRPAHFLKGGMAFQRERPRTEGCLVCGEELVYSQVVSPEHCLVCGHSFATQVKCRNNHYICDICHAQDILQKIESMLVFSHVTNPVSLAQLIFELPGLNMHGPEYQSIVPAVLITAYQNQSGTRQVPDIQEAIRRGREVTGGSCGLHGNCGAGVGAGIAVSILEKATPLSGKARGAANRATAQALLAISEHVGPRCCKRDAITAITTFVQNTPYFSEISTSTYTCQQYRKNKSCIGQSCPYYPAKG
jgi:hypothetical protein